MQEAHCISAAARLSAARRRLPPCRRPLMVACQLGAPQQARTALEFWRCSSSKEVRAGSVWGRRPCRLPKKRSEAPPEGCPPPSSQPTAPSPTYPPFSAAARRLRCGCHTWLGSCSRRQCTAVQRGSHHGGGVPLGFGWEGRRACPPCGLHGNGRIRSSSAHTDAPVPASHRHGTDWLTKSCGSLSCIALRSGAKQQYWHDVRLPTVCMCRHEARCIMRLCSPHHQTTLLFADASPPACRSLTHA